MSRLFGNLETSPFNLTDNLILRRSTFITRLWIVLLLGLPVVFVLASLLGVLKTTDSASLLCVIIFMMAIFIFGINQLRKYRRWQTNYFEHPALKALFDSLVGYGNVQSRVEQLAVELQDDHVTVSGKVGNYYKATLHVTENWVFLVSPPDILNYFGTIKPFYAIPLQFIIRLKAETSRVGTKSYFTETSHLHIITSQGDIARFSSNNAEPIERSVAIILAAKPSILVE